MHRVFIADMSLRARKPLRSGFLNLEVLEIEALHERYCSVKKQQARHVLMR